MASTGGLVKIEWDEPVDKGGTPVTKYALYARKAGVAEYEKIGEVKPSDRVFE